MLNPAMDLQDIVHDMLHEAKRQGADDADVTFGLNKGFSVTARQGDIETIEYHQDKGIEITVFFGKRSGSASLSDIRPDAIRSAVEAACHIARFTDEDPFSGLPERDELAFHYPKIEAFYPWSISVEEAGELAKQCEAEALKQDKRILNSEGVTLTTVEAGHFHGNSLGFIGSFAGTRHEISCLLIAKENGEMQRDYSYTVSCDPTALRSIHDIAKEAAERTVRRLGSRRLTTRKAPVIFVAEEARGLFGHFISAIQGGNLYRKTSFLLDHLDKPVFAPHIHIQEDPLLLKGLGSAPFDDDGVGTRGNVFVDQGILRSYAMGVYSARKLGMRTTGNAGGVHNLIVKTGQQSLAQLLKTMNTGLLVTELMGQGINLVTGDYSRGASGYWVENGEIRYPVQEITIAGNLRDMFKGIREVGADVDTRGNIRTGSVLVDEMTIAGG